MELPPEDLNPKDFVKTEDDKKKKDKKHKKHHHKKDKEFDDMKGMTDEQL